MATSVFIFLLLSSTSYRGQLRKLHLFRVRTFEHGRLRDFREKSQASVRAMASIAFSPSPKRAMDSRWRSSSL